MKRFLVIPLLFLYLTAASGVMIHLHYCGKNLDSWNLYVENDGCDDGFCDKKNDQSHGCCKDEVIAAKLSHDHQHASSLILKLTQQDVILPLPIYNYEPVVTHNTCSAKDLVYSPNAPPGLWQQIPPYILYSNLTYYG